MQHRSRSLVYLLALAALILCDTRTAAACSPAYNPNPWFLTTVDFDASPLPDGVTLRYEQGDTSSNGELFITNPSTTPLYILSEAGGGDDGTNPISDMPKDTQATYRLLDGVWFTWSDNRWALLDHQSDEKSWGPGQAWRVSIPLLDIKSSMGEFTDRPTDVAVPPMEQGNFRFIFGDTVIAVPMTVTYTLNPDYVPPSTRSYGSGCNHMTQFIPYCVVVVVVIGAALGFGLYKSNKIA